MIYPNRRIKDAALVCGVTEPSRVEAKPKEGTVICDA